jgi:hypothetical protein
MWTRARAVVLGLAGLSLAACGNIHPGDAAVVDGRSISMKSFDDTAKIYCDLSLRSAAAQGVKEISNADVRRQAIVEMVTVRVARQVAAPLGAIPKPQVYELTSDQRAQISKAFPKNGDAVATAIQNSQEASAIAVALGEQETGLKRSADNSADLAQVGQKQIRKAFPAHHVRFAPLFGLSGTLKKVATTGSLSVPGKATKSTTSTLPVAQRCA